MRPDRNRGVTALFVYQSGPCGTCADTGRALGAPYRLRHPRRQTGLVMDSELPAEGEIRITWTRGHDPKDFDTYAWGVQCAPSLPDEVVAGILSEVLKVY